MYIDLVGKKQNQQQHKYIEGVKVWFNKDHVCIHDKNILNNFSSI